MAITSVIVSVGELNTPIEIQRFNYGTDEYGIQQLEWITIASPRCKVDFDDRLIRQILRDDGVDTTSVKLFTMRYIPNITTKDRIFYKDTVFFGTYGVNKRMIFLNYFQYVFHPILIFKLTRATIIQYFRILHNDLHFIIFLQFTKQQVKRSIIKTV